MGKTKSIWSWIVKREAIWIKVMKAKESTPKDPTLLSFIAFRRFFSPAKIPSKVSIKPSRWRPPVIKYPEAKQISTEELIDQEFALNKIKMELCINPIRKPMGGANCAMFLNFGKIKGNFGKVV